MKPSFVLPFLLISDDPHVLRALHLSLVLKMSTTQSSSQLSSQSPHLVTSVFCLSSLIPIFIAFFQSSVQFTYDWSVRDSVSIVVGGLASFLNGNVKAKSIKWSTCMRSHRHILTLRIYRPIYSVAYSVFVVCEDNYLQLAIMYHFKILILTINVLCRRTSA